MYVHHGRQHDSCGTACYRGAAAPARDVSAGDICVRLEAWLTKQGCECPSHVPPRRELREETILDRRHLGGCLLEDPDCLDDSHLLPPHPLVAAQEYCCENRCLPRWDARYLTECVYTSVHVRARRQRELRRFGKRAFNVTA